VIKVESGWMARGFDPQGVRLDGISLPRTMIGIETVVYRAFVEVNEEGRQAAATTLVMML
jgi:serine protease inhibitor